MNKKLLQIILCAVLLAAAYIVERFCALPMWAMLLVYLVPYLTISYDVIAEAVEDIAEGEVFSEDFLMLIATVGALCIGFLPNAEPQFLEAVFVMLFFQVGELFEDYAEDKSRRSISHLMDIRPDKATIEVDGELKEVAAEDVQVGDLLVVRVGDRIPVDGDIVEGQTSLNTVALTGESMPREASVGDEVLSGCVNLSAVIKLKAKKVLEESTVSQIINLVENAAEKKSKSESFISRFARIYTPIVVILALVLAFLPPLFAESYVAGLSVWLYRALTFLVVSCPCALVISVPLSFFGGLGGASRHGVLIKGSAYMDTLAKLKTVVFDKTGTLTHGEFEVEAVHPDKLSEKELLHLAAHVERFSTHPIAVSLRNAYPEENDDCSVDKVEEVAGQGVRAVVNGQVVCVGNERMMQAVGAKWRPCHHKGTIVHVSVDGEYAGHVVITDKIKQEAKEAISDLKKEGVERTIMLTGDRKEVAAAVAEAIGIDEYHSDLLPQDKVREIERLLSERADNEKLAFVGDGINDAPVLALSDVGIAMGALGSEAAIEAADVVLMDDNPQKVATAIKVSKHTIHIARENVVFAIGVKVAVLGLAAVGLASMGMAVFADVGVMVLAVLNSMRTLRK